MQQRKPNQPIQHAEVIVIGAGPCGLAAAIALQDKGLKPLMIEKGNVVHSIYRYPTHQTFFSTPEKLEIGGVPFIIEQKKPKRNQALAYYREVARIKQLTIHTYEEVTAVECQASGEFLLKSISQHHGERLYQTPFLVVATGYYDSPNLLGIPGEELPKVFHYFKEAHPFYNQDVVVIGGKNSAVDATLELEKAGARVTVLYRGEEIGSAVKPWILPEFQSLINHGKITIEYGAIVKEITPTDVMYEVKGQTKRIKNDFVMAMTGYHPDHSFLTKMGVKLDQETGRPAFNPETMESNVPNLFVAGVIAAGNEANEIFIENGRFHGGLIAEEIVKKMARGN